MKEKLAREDWAIMMRELGEPSRFTNRPIKEWDDAWKRFATDHQALAKKAVTAMRWHRSDVP